MDDSGEQGLLIIKEFAEVLTIMTIFVSTSCLRVLEGWLSERIKIEWSASWVGDVGNRFCFDGHLATKGKQKLFGK